MPLLGKVVFSEPGPTSNPHGVEEAYRIPHTKEVFTSREEYEERLKLYSRRVWTCQCTGHINLTHEEAFESERKSRENLARTFPEIYEKPVLNVAHHSSEVLDKIVNSAYKLVHSRLFEGQKVNFEVTPGKKFDAQIVSVSNSKNESAHANGEGSPSSDKENHSAKQALITDMFKAEKETKAAESSSGEPGQISEMAELKYDVMLLTENKIIRGVPSKTLAPVSRPPSRHNIRLFIRTNAIRHDLRKQKAWIVDKHMVQKYKLQGRFSKDEEENFLRASSIHAKSFVGYTHPSAVSNGLPHCNGSEKQTEQKSPKTSQSGEPILIVNIPESPSSDSQKTKTKGLKLAPIFSPRAKKQKKCTDIAAAISLIDFDFLEKVPTKTLDSKKKSKQVKPQQLKRKRKSKSSTASTPKKRKKIIDGGCISDEDSLPLSKLNKGKSAPKSPGSSRKSSSPKKKKQATLLELTRKKGGMMLMTSKKSHTLGSSPSGSPAKKPRAPRQPPIVYQLLRLKKERKIHKYKSLINDAAKMLNEKQRKNLPEMVKQDILVKWEIFERKRKWDNMTPQERKTIRAQNRVKSMQRYEDSDLAAPGKVKSLPTFEIAPIPGGLPNSVFGDIAMLVEFFHWHRSALGQKDNYRVTHASLAEALSAGKQGYESISKILMMVFHMLLNDNVAADYKEIDFAIDKVPINPVVCSELARICLRQLDDDFDEDPQNKSDDQMEDDSVMERAAGVREEVFSKLLENEIYELEAEEQLEILCALVYRLINTYTAQGYREEAREKATELNKKLLKMKMKESLIKKEQKLQEQESKEKENEVSPPKTMKEDPEAKEEESADLISRVKRRRIGAMERKQEEEEQKLKRDEERRRLYELQMKEAEYEKLSKQVKEANVAAARAMRLDALGTDRNHNRYWLFCDSTPGLFIEKGWVQDYIHYSTYVETKKKSSSTASDDEPLMSVSLAAGNKPSSTETTLPHVGQNLWFVIDSKEKLDETLSCFCAKGIRESKLKSKIEKKYNHIVKLASPYSFYYHRQKRQTFFNGVGQWFSTFFGERNPNETFPRLKEPLYIYLIVKSLSITFNSQVFQKYSS